MLHTRLALAFVILLATLATLPAAVANKKPPAAPVNLNTASSEELQLVPGIGPATAEKILQMDDLLAIKGIGPKRLEKMRKYLTVGKAPSSNKPTAPAKPPASPSP
jgi:DNA uptake protein ComE-like DNA-binding protein